MKSSMQQHKGFTLVELVAILILVGILSVSVVGRLFSSSTFELQASRDQVVSAFFSAQQLAMVQRDAIQLTTSTGQVDIRRDANGDNIFSVAESIRLDGTQFPLSLKASQALTASTFLFNRLGRTSEGMLTLSQGSSSVSIVVSSAGYAQ